MKKTTLISKTWIKGILLLSAILLANFNSNAQVVLDAHSNAAGATTWNITTTHANELIILSCGGYGVGGSSLSTAPGTVKVNGSNATYETEGLWLNPSFSWQEEIWAYVAPTVGTYTCTCTEAGIISPFYFNFAASVYQPNCPAGLNLSNVFLGGNNDIHDPTTISATITTPIANCWVYGSVNNNDNGGSGTVAWSGQLTEIDHQYINNGIDGAQADSTYATAGTYTITSTDIGASNVWMTIALIGVEPNPSCCAYTATATSTNITCNGANNGTATAVPNPVGAYTYLWAPGGQTSQTISGLSAGTYTVSVMNAGCTVTASVTITQPTAIVIANTITNVACNGGATGKIVANVNGGTPAYTYSWSPVGGTGATASNLSVGCYTLTVTDANGCIQTASACITQPTSLTTSMATTLAACGSNNGTATVTVNGGTPGYTYAWAPIGGNGATATGLSTGSYTVTVTDANGCTITASANISNAGGVTANVSLVINEPCFGDNVGEIDITDAGGVPPYSYSWTNGATTQNITGLTAGGYTVTVTDQNGCSAVANATVTQPTAVTANISGSSNILCNGGATGSATVTAGGGTPGYNYAWSNAATTSTINGLTAGTYNVTVTDANGCTGTATVTLTEPTAINLATAATNAFCGQPDGTANVIANGGVPGYNYIWNNGATTSGISNLLPGNY